MDLNEYLASPSALSVSALRARMVELGSTIKSDAQIRQWRTKYYGRLPDPANCVLIERATDGTVTRQCLRPDDWEAIWPEIAEARA